MSPLPLRFNLSLPHNLSLVLISALCMTLGLASQSCQSNCSSTLPELAELSLSALKPERARESGALLMRLRAGLHSLKPDLDTTQSSSSISSTSSNRPHIILVHGYASRGYEWVHAALTLANRGDVYFYRWDWEGCPDQGAGGLLRALDALVKDDSSSTQHPVNRPIEVYGHSYGGVISAVMAAQYQGAAPLDVHLIAAPLAGHPRIDARCKPSISELTAPLRASNKQPQAAPQITLHQWRTQHHLDGAFKDLTPDPQVVEWRGEVTRLPEVYREHRLGHNWSISWVVDHLISRWSQP